MRIAFRIACGNNDAERLPHPTVGATIISCSPSVGLGTLRMRFPMGGKGNEAREARFVSTAPSGAGFLSLLGRVQADRLERRTVRSR